MGISDILHIARSGMMTSQTQLSVTGQNITNAYSPGYSRKQVEVGSSNVPGNMPGIGANIVSLHRVHDQFLEKQANAHRGGYGFMDGRQLVASQLETVFLELDDAGINAGMNEFFNSLRELSNNPSGMAERRMVVYSAQQLTERINTSYANLENIQTNLNETLSAEVDGANALITELASLNAKIGALADPSGRNEASDLLDRRDQVVRELHELVGGKSFTDADGSINFSLANNTLVEGANAGRLNIVDDQFDGISMTTAAGNDIDITGFLGRAGGDGKLAGIIYERDVQIEDLKTRLDTLAFTMANEISAIHQASFGLDGNSGRDFFEPLAGVTGAAGLIAVNQEIIDNPDFIAAAQDPASVHGDNRSLMAIIDLQDDSVPMGGSTFNEYFTDIVGQASSEMQGIESELTYEASVLEQAENMRQSVAGVNVDEEMANLIQFQRAFEASAQMISAVDEMLATIIAMKQ